MHVPGRVSEQSCRQAAQMEHGRMRILAAALQAHQQLLMAQGISLMACHTAQRMLKAQGRERKIKAAIT